MDETPSVGRVPQLDALTLDDELLQLLSSRVRSMFAWFEPGHLERYLPEIRAILHAMVLIPTILLDKQSPGQSIQQVRWSNVENPPTLRRIWNEFLSSYNHPIGDTGHGTQVDQLGTRTTQADHLATRNTQVRIPHDQFASDHTTNSATIQYTEGMSIPTQSRSASHTPVEPSELPVSRYNEEYTRPRNIGFRSAASGTVNGSAGAPTINNSGERVMPTRHDISAMAQDFSRTHGSSSSTISTLTSGSRMDNTHHNTNSAVYNASSTTHRANAGASSQLRPSVSDRICKRIRNISVIWSTLQNLRELIRGFWRKLYSKETEPQPWLNSQKRIIFVVASIIVPWAMDRLKQHIERYRWRQAEQETASISHTSNVSSWQAFAKRSIALLFELSVQVWRIVSVVNNLTFLSNGKYPNLLAQVLHMRMIRATPLPARVSPAYDILARQLLWDGCMEFVDFVREFIDWQYISRLMVIFIRRTRHTIEWTRLLLIYWFSRVRNYVTKLRRYNRQETCQQQSQHNENVSGSLDSGEVQNNTYLTENVQRSLDTAIISLCVCCGRNPANMPMVCSPCGHTACYFCLHSSLLADNEFECPRCGVGIEKAYRK